MENLTNDQLFTIYQHLANSAHEAHIAWRLAWHQDKALAREIAGAREFVTSAMDDVYGALNDRGALLPES